jgi:hypothetical protein
MLIDDRYIFPYGLRATASGFAVAFAHIVKCEAPQGR